MHAHTRKDRKLLYFDEKFDGEKIIGPSGLNPYNFQIPVLNKENTRVWEEYLYGTD